MDEYECADCGRQISPDASANGCGRCEWCWLILSHDRQDRLLEQELMLSDLMYWLYPQATVAA